MTATEYVAPEYVILVDENDQPIGTAEKLLAHQQNLLHRAFSVFIFRETPTLEVLLQQRALTKYHSPGLWTNTCCSHPRPGEDILAAGERRLQEEMGLSISLREVGWFKYQADFPNGLSEHEVDHVLTATVSTDQPIPFNPAEVHTTKWISVTDLQRSLATNPAEFTPWLAQALELALLKS